MKKHTVGFTLLTLICVPFLVVTTSVVNAEDTQSTSESSTEISSVEESVSRETSEIEIPKKTNKEIVDKLLKKPKKQSAKDYLLSFNKHKEKNGMNIINKVLDNKKGTD